MKKIILYLVAVVCLSSCWQKAPDGRLFKTDYICEYGHNYTHTEVEYDIVTKMTLPVTHTDWICDIGYYDTTWKK